MSIINCIYLLKIIFGDLVYGSKDAKNLVGKVIGNDVLRNISVRKCFILLKNKCQIKAGSHVAYFDKNGKMRDCTFLCAENQKEYRNLTPIDIIADMLCSEEEIWYFCNQNNIGDPDSHVYRLLEVKKIDSR